MRGSAGGGPTLSLATRGILMEDELNINNNLTTGEIYFPETITDVGGTVEPTSELTTSEVFVEPVVGQKQTKPRLSGSKRRRLKRMKKQESNPVAPQTDKDFMTPPIGVSAFGQSIMMSPMKANIFGRSTQASPVQSNIFGQRTVTSPVEADTPGQSPRTSPNKFNAFGRSTVTSHIERFKFNQSTTASPIEANTSGHSTIKVNPFSPNPVTAPIGVNTLGQGRVTASTRTAPHSSPRSDNTPGSHNVPFSFAVYRNDPGFVTPPAVADKPRQSTFTSFFGLTRPVSTGGNESGPSTFKSPLAVSKLGKSSMSASGEVNKSSPSIGTSPTGVNRAGPSSSPAAKRSRPDTTPPVPSTSGGAKKRPRPGTKPCSKSGNSGFGIKMAIVKEGFPADRLTEEEAMNLKDTIVDAIMDQTEGDPPQFVRTTYDSGGLVAVCANKHTVRWLEDFTKTDPVDQMKLTVLPANILHLRIKVICYVPFEATTKDLNRILAMLAKQNPGLNTNTWQVLSCRETETGKTLVMYIDEDSLKVLQSLEFRPFLGLQRVTFKHMDKRHRPRQ